MKNLKKLLAVALSFAILLTLTVPVMAAELTAAEKVELLGILQGEGDGVNEEYLSKATTRVQGAILLLRLMGKEDEAMAYAGQDNFTDVVGNEWFASVLAYVKANPSLGFVGYPDGSFQPRKIMTGAELYKVLLTVLGYEQDVDYTWAQVAEKAGELGLVSIDNPSAAITNGEMADAILEGLQADMKSGVALLDSLIADGIISAADASAAGLVTELAIISAVPTNADEITVTFSKPVEGEPAITVKSGFMNIFVNKTWNDAKTQVVLKRANNIAFSAGTYELAIGDLNTNVKFEKEVAQSLAVVTSTVQIGTDAEIEVVLYNQYGKKMNASSQDFSATAFNKTSGTTLFVKDGSAKNKFEITVPSATKENEIIVVTAMHHQSTIVGQAELTAVLESKVTQFAMTGVVLPTNANNVNTTHSNVVITYEAYDQYGNKITIKDKTDVTSGTGLTFISSDESILKVSEMKFDSKGNLTFNPLKAGTVTLSVLVNSAAVVTSLPITVFDPAAVNKVIIGEPVKEVVEGETTEIGIIALDQFGNELEAKNVTKGEGKLTFSPVGKDDLEFAIEEGKLTVKPGAGTKGYVTVYYSWKGTLQGSFTLNIWEKAVPTGIETVTINGGIELGATHRLLTKDIKVVDQYGRAYSGITSDFKVGINADSFTLKADPATGGKVTASTTSAATYFDFAADAAAEGSVTYTIQLNGKDDSAYSFTLKAVDVNKAANGVTYKFAKVPTLYSGTFGSTANAADYAVEMSIEGRTSDGTVVTLKSGKIHRLLSSNPNVVVDGLKLYSKVNSAQTTTVRAYDSAGKLLCQADVQATKGRSINSVVFGADKALSADTHALVGALGFKVNDEYGVNMVATTATISVVADKFDLEKDGFFAYSVVKADKESAVDAGVTIDYTNKTFTLFGEAGDQIELTYVANNGLRDSIVITIK